MGEQIHEIIDSKPSKDSSVFGTMLNEALGGAAIVANFSISLLPNADAETRRIIHEAARRSAIVGFNRGVSYGRRKNNLFS